MATARVHLERPAEFANDLRSCRLLVDGRPAGSIPVERPRTFAVATGERRLAVEIGGDATNAIVATLAREEDVVLACGSPKFVPYDVAQVLGELRRPFLLWPSFDLALAWFARGEERLRVGDRSGAEAAFERGARGRPADPLGYLRVATLANQRGATDRARAAADQALALDPAHVEARLERARSLRSDPMAVLRELERLHALVPDHATGHHERALALLALGRREAAVSALDQAVGGPGVPDDARQLRRRLNAELGRRDPTDAEFGRLFLDAYRRLARGYDGLGYEYIQRVKGLDREGFARFVTGARFGRLGEAERAAFHDASPEEVAARFRGRLQHLHGNGGGAPLTTHEDLWLGLLSALASVR